LGGLQKQLQLRLQLKPFQTGFFGPTLVVKLAIKPFSASIGVVKPQNRGFTGFMDGFHFGEKHEWRSRFAKYFSKPVKPLQQ